MRNKTIHIILVVLNLMALFLVMQIELGLFPVFPSPFDYEITIRINRLLSNFCQGLILSSLFYLVVVFLPQHRKALITRKLAESSLREIVNKMQKTIGYVLYRYNIPLNNDIMSGLKQTDFEHVTMFEDVVMNFRFQYEISPNNWTGAFTGKFKELCVLRHDMKKIMIYINKVLNIPIIQYEDEEVIECLAELRASTFYWSISVDQTDFKYPCFNTAIYDYYKIYSKLSKHIRPYKFKILRDGEKNCSGEWELTNITNKGDEIQRYHIPNNN